MQAQISKVITTENVSVDLKISILKPIHAKWVTQCYNRIYINKGIGKMDGTDLG